MVLGEYDIRQIAADCKKHDMSMPAIFLSLTITSFGHLTPASRPNIALIVFATAKDATKVNLSASFGPIAGRKTIESQSPPFGENQDRPALPFPRVCISAEIASFPSLLFPAISFATSFVEETLPYLSIV